MLLLLSGCGLVETEYITDTPEDHRVRVVLEEDNSFYAEEYVQETEIGGDVSFALSEVCGRKIEGTDYRGECSIADGKAENEKILTVKNVRYSTVISVRTEQEVCEIIYHSTEESVRVTVPHTHLRVNTARADELFEKPGYTLIGWNSSLSESIVLGQEFVNQDLSAQTLVRPGSRIDFADQIDLYAVWVPWTAETKFSFEESGNGIVITGFAETVAYDEITIENGEVSAQKSDTVSPNLLSIPAEIGGRPVYGIAAEAFADAEIKTLVLPVGLRYIENGAFRGAKIRDVYLFDDLQTVSGHAFDECTELTTLHLGAAREPVYSGNYFDTFADKCDRLRTIQDEPKIVLFSGSSTRFGYDSRMIEEAMGRKVANMGVFAYTNALPQLLIIRESMRADDILLVSPEFDAAQSQFCVSRQMEPQIYAMCESDYALLERIDLAEVTNVFGALDTFLKNRNGMEAKSYDITAADFDEDGNPVTTPSYNEFGDYILYRPNAETEEPVYGLGVDYTTAALPKAQFIDPFNDAMEMFLSRGVDVYFTYSPRNVLALSEGSTEAAREELDKYLRQNLVIPVISDLEESLYTGMYLYGTDNHLSTEGVQIRTERVIEDLRNRN